MTVDARTDLPDDAIDWQTLLEALADAESFADMVGPLYGSGALIADYECHAPDDADWYELPDDLDALALRALLTELVREGQTSPGMGDAHYWHGTIDTVLDELARRVGAFYPLPLPEYVLPRRIPPCPTCGRTDRIQYRLAGMPPAPPPDFDMDRVIFAGCIIEDEPEPSFRCARDGIDFDFDPPGYTGDDAWDLDLEDAP